MQHNANHLKQETTSLKKLTKSSKSAFEAASNGEIIVSAAISKLDCLAAIVIILEAMLDERAIVLTDTKL